MKIDGSSAWEAQLVDGTTHHFDTPRCALATWLEQGKKGEVRVQEYYDRTYRDGHDVRFVLGSDVVGPMGNELVPVDAARAVKFQKDHGGVRTLALVDLGAVKP
jgi:hypothetical protein